MTTVSVSSVRSNGAGRGGDFRAADAVHLSARPEHLRRHGDAARRDPLGLSAEEGRLLRQRPPAPLLP